MLYKVRSLGLQGISGYEVTAECDLSGGLPNFDIVGLPDAAVKEARERVRAAIKNSGYAFPVGRITVNLAPANRRKSGTVYDLPILVGILAAAGVLDWTDPDCAFVGELSLSGTLRPVVGMLPMALAARQAGIQRLFVPPTAPQRPPWPRASSFTRWRRCSSWPTTCPAGIPFRRRPPGRGRRPTCPYRTLLRSGARSPSSGCWKLPPPGGTTS